MTSSAPSGTQAQAGLELQVDLGDLPVPEALEGLPVRDDQGVQIGRVLAVQYDPEGLQVRLVLEDREGPVARMLQRDLAHHVRLVTRQGRVDRGFPSP